jgi:LAS superfamily LD-carboxypeptidase LdcB
MRVWAQHKVQQLILILAVCLLVVTLTVLNALQPKHPRQIAVVAKPDLHVLPKPSNTAATTVPKAHSLTATPTNFIENEVKAYRESTAKDLKTNDNSEYMSEQEQELFKKLFLAAQKQGNPPFDNAD